MLDEDLAILYGVKTKNLNLQVKRNIRRFPEDFMFKLSKEEALRLHSATSKRVVGDMHHMLLQNKASHAFKCS